MTPTGPQTFAFLFRTDAGRIDRATWWRGSLPLVGLALVGTLVWLGLRPYAHHDLSQEPFLAPMTLLAYVYLLAYAFALILLAICEYNLSAKRFHARGLPGALAGVLPGSLLLGLAILWYIPRYFGSVPEWAAPVTVVTWLAIGLWNIVELGLRPDRRHP